MNFHLICDHERRVKAHTKLTDEILWRVPTFLEGLEEGFGAGMRDGAEILDHLVVRHADAVIGDSDGLGVAVDGDVDIEFQLGVLDVLLGTLDDAHLLHRVGGVGNELAEEDLFVGVERVNDEIEQLLDLGLEGMFFEGVLTHEQNLGAGIYDLDAECQWVP